MKKTLFLSAMLATALCSSAFADATTDSITISTDGDHIGTETAPYNFQLQSGNSVQWEVTMENGTWITNTGNADRNHVQIHSLTLAENGTGTITVDEGKMLSFISGSYGKSYLTLNGGTLVKKGSGEMVFSHVEYASGKSSDTGTIDIQGGTFSISNDNNAGGDAGLYGPNYAVKVASSATMNVERVSTIKSLNTAGTVDLKTGKLTIKDALTLNGGTLKHTGNNTSSFEAKELQAKGTFALDKITGTVSTFVAMADNTSMTLQNGTQLTASDTDTAYGIWINKGASITISDTSSIQVGSLTIGANDGQTATASRLNADSTAKIGKHAYNYQKNLKLENAAVTYTGSGTLYLGSMNGGSITTTANIELAAADSTLGSLTLSGNTITLGTAAAHDKTLTITSTLAVTANSTMNANLVMNSGTMTFASGSILTMGCNVTIGDDAKVYITGDIAAIRGGEEVTIINGLTTLDTVNLGNAQIYVNNALQGDFFLKQSADGTRIVVAPEPATATLSLLALAGLAARRKRH